MRDSRRQTISAKACAAALGVSSYFSLILAQQAPAVPPTFRSSVDVVQLDVRVLDGRRRPIMGLTAADFTVLENGRPRPIVGFQPITLADRAPATSAANSSLVPSAESSHAPGRAVVIIVDRAIPYGWPAESARRFALAVVDKLGPDDVAAVLSTAPLAEQQDFTSDRERLRSVIARLPLGATLSAGVVPGDLPTRVEDRSAECYCDVCSVDAVTRVANSLAALGQIPKVAFFIAAKIDALAFEQRNFLMQACTGHRVAALNEMLEATARTNLVVHTMDPTGLESRPQFRADRRSNGTTLPGSQNIERNPNSLLTLADFTGGRAVLNTNAPASRLDELFAESAAFYLLGFTPADANARGSSRRIEVRVNRRDVEVRTRRSYFPFGEARQPIALAPRPAP